MRNNGPLHQVNYVLAVRERNDLFRTIVADFNSKDCIDFAQVLNAEVFEEFGLDHGNLNLRVAE